MKVTGCVLAGGDSTRMGSDKALLMLGDKQLITIALEGFEEFDEVFISAADAESYAFTGAQVVVDEIPFIGPLGGVISALRYSSTDLVCFRPVDTPLVPAGLHMAMAASNKRKCATVPIAMGKTEPLLACYSKSALPVLEAFADRGDFSLANALHMIDTRYIRLDSDQLLPLFGDPVEYLVNINDFPTFLDIENRNDEVLSE